MKRRRPRRIKIVERKLGRETGGHGRVYGLAYFDSDLIELDPRQRPKAFFDTAIHELLHLALPTSSEYRISRTANLLSRHLWRLGYRRVSQ